MERKSIYSCFCLSSECSAAINKGDSRDVKMLRFSLHKVSFRDISTVIFVLLCPPFFLCAFDFCVRRGDCNGNFVKTPTKCLALS